MDDLLQLAAYAIILIVIGAASVIKKMVEAQKRRKLQEEQNARRQASVSPAGSRGLQLEEKTPARHMAGGEEPEKAPEPVYSESRLERDESEPVYDEPVPESEKETERHPDERRDPSGESDLKEILRKAFGFPYATDEEKRKRERKSEQTRLRKAKTEPVVVVSETKPLKEVTEELEPESIKQLVAEPRRDVGAGWSDFIEDLNTQQSSELAKAVILSEVIALPISLRQRKNLRTRLI